MIINIDSSFWIGGVGTVVLGYILFKLSHLQYQIKKILKSIPSPEQLAKEILKAKIPINSLPPEAIAAYNKLPKDKTKIPYAG